MRSEDKIKLEIETRTKERLLLELEQESCSLRANNKISSPAKRIIMYKLNICQKKLTRLEALAVYSSRSSVAYETELEARIIAHEDSALRISELERQYAFALSTNNKYDTKEFGKALKRERTRCGTLRKSVESWELRKALLDSTKTSSERKKEHEEKIIAEGGDKPSIDDLRAQFGDHIARAAEQAMQYHSLSKEEKEKAAKPYDYSTKIDLGMFEQVHKEIEEDRNNTEIEAEEKLKEDDSLYKPIDAPSLNDVLDQPFEI